MRRALLFLLLVTPVYLCISLYFTDRVYFLSPVEYKSSIPIREDSRGSGLFASPRNGRRAHRGLDLFAPLGSPVFASRAGIIAVVRDEKMGMGKYIVIRHPGKISTLYGHLSYIYVRKNQLVRQGEMIARVGKTGNANSSAILPHLHFEISKNGEYQDPLEYLE